MDLNNEYIDKQNVHSLCTYTDIHRYMYYIFYFIKNIYSQFFICCCHVNNIMSIFIAE